MGAYRATRSSAPGVFLCAGAAALIALAAPLRAQAPADESAVSAQIAELEQRVAALWYGQHQTWLDQRRSEEVKAQVRQVLADADTRASLAEGGLSAGYTTGKGLFLAAEDGSLLLRITGQIQFRYIYNHSDTTSGDPDEAGFQARRTKLEFSGHVGAPRFSYAVQINADRDSGALELYQLEVGYAWNEHWGLKLGMFKAPFMREDLVSSKRQQAVERSLVNELFSVQKTDGVQLEFREERYRLAAIIHDGSDQKNTDFSLDTTDFAIAARGEWVVTGIWDQFKDFVSWSTDPFGVLLGAAIDYEQGDSGVGSSVPDLLKCTVDVSVEGGGWSVFAAFVGQHLGGDGSAGWLPADQYGLLVQGGVFLIPDTLDAFVRWEHLELDGVQFRAKTGAVEAVADSSLSILTVGTNYYLREHHAKLTVDVMYLFDAVHRRATGLGILASDDGGQIVLRTQFQLLF